AARRRRSRALPRPQWHARWRPRQRRRARPRNGRGPPLSTAAATLPVDPAAVRDIMIAAAASAVLPRFKALHAGDIRQKSRPTDRVTEADLHCQAILTEKRGALLPEGAIVGEEGGGSESEACTAIAAAEWCWVIDPLDGTHNFVHSRTGFVVMVALVHRGETV